MQVNFFRSNFFLFSFSTSTILAAFGFILFFLQFSALITVLSLVIFAVGFVQVVVDLGWIGMVKINANLKTWQKAYNVVATQRTQKIFLVPFIVDIGFIILSVTLFAIYGMKI